MALKFYKHLATGEVIRTLKGSPGEGWEELLVPADSKFLEKVDTFNNKSQVKNLKELNTRWREELAWLMKKRNLNLNYLWQYIKIFFKFKHKRERLKFILDKLKETVKIII